MDEQRCVTAKDYGSKNSVVRPELAECGIMASFRRVVEYDPLFVCY